MNEKEITLVRTVDAPRERVWKAWTDPEEVKKWWGPRGTTTPECRIDLRVGGEIYAVMLAGAELGPMAGQRWPMRGTFKEITPNEKLVFENNAIDEQGNVLLSGMTSVMLEDDGDKTEITVMTGAKGDGPNVEQMLGGMEQGWSEQLDKLGELLSS